MHPHRRPLRGARRAAASFGPALAILAIGIATFVLVLQRADADGATIRALPSSRGSTSLSD
jgi:hypothetical protein